MNAQEIFDKAALGVLKQEKLAVDRNNPGKQCWYRTPDGCACAVGQLIDDATAKRWDDYENSTLDDILSYETNAPLFLRDHRAMLIEMQEVHDQSIDLDEFKTRMIQLGKTHRLDTKAVEEFGL